MQLAQLPGYKLQQMAHAAIVIQKMWRGRRARQANSLNVLRAFAGCITKVWGDEGRLVQGENGLCCEQQSYQLGTGRRALSCVACMPRCSHTPPRGRATWCSCAAARALQATPCATCACWRAWDTSSSRLVRGWVGGYVMQDFCLA